MLLSKIIFCDQYFNILFYLEIVQLSKDYTLVITQFNISLNVMLTKNFGYYAYSNTLQNITAIDIKVFLGIITQYH